MPEAGVFVGPHVIALATTDPSRRARVWIRESRLTVYLG